MEREIENKIIKTIKFYYWYFNEKNKYCKDNNTLSWYWRRPNQHSIKKHIKFVRLIKQIMTLSWNV